MSSSVNSAEDLSKQTKIKYGTFCCGSTNAFFGVSYTHNSMSTSTSIGPLDTPQLSPTHLQSSTIPTYQKLNAFMESTKPSVMTKSNSEGLDRVRKGEGLYAFFMEAAAIEYHVERYCELKQLGGLLDSKGYGIALPKGQFTLMMQR
jgi:hypothetical protein